MAAALSAPPAPARAAAPAPPATSPVLSPREAAWATGKPDDYACADRDAATDFSPLEPLDPFKLDATRSYEAVGDDTWFGGLFACGCGFPGMARPP